MLYCAFDSVMCSCSKQCSTTLWQNNTTEQKVVLQKELVWQHHMHFWGIFWCMVAIYILKGSCMQSFLGCYRIDVILAPWHLVHLWDQPPLPHLEIYTPFVRQRHSKVLGFDKLFIPSSKLSLHPIQEWRMALINSCMLRSSTCNHPLDETNEIVLCCWIIVQSNK